VAEHVLIVDIALDSPPGLSPTMSVLGPTFAPDELAARKLLALYGRALPRDFVDVFRIVKVRDKAVILGLARDLDAGLDVTALVVAMNQVDRYSDEQLGIDAAEGQDLRESFRSWIEELGTA
jgi:predicted nucleotidyltransferase component of viral defense system